MTDIGEFRAGDTVGDTYTVIGYIGRGAMGHVYRVRHKILTKEYALKTLSSELVNPITWRRFQNEAQAISIMTHPNVVSIHNLGLHDDRIPYYVMDLLSGTDLGQKLRAEGALDPKFAIKMFIEVCTGLSYAHKKGIVHRDIKPGNIFLLDKPGASGETVKVVDFGIAKLSQTKDPENQGLTAVGDVLGTPYYMSPEQCVGQRVDARSDIYSVGCTLFEVLTASPPFRGRNSTETMMLHGSALPLSLRQASGGKIFPEYLEKIIETTLAKEKSERYQNMDQLIQDLTAVVEEDMVSALGASQAAAQGAPIQRYAAPPTLKLNRSAPVSNPPPRKPPILVVAPLVLVVLAMGGFAYWHYAMVPKKTQTVPLSDQLSHFNPKLDNILEEDSDVHKMIYNNGKDDFNDKPADDRVAKGQVVSASLMVQNPFSRMVEIDGKEKRQFNFPDDVAIGLFHSRSIKNKKLTSGTITVAAGENITFSPSDVVGRYPDCLKRFRPGDIFCIKFADGSLNDPVLRACVNLNWVRKLDFSNCPPLPSAGITLLNSCQNLTQFDSNDSGLDGTYLAKAQCWKHVEDMNLNSIKNVLPLLQALKDSPDLRKISLCRCELKPREFHALAELTQLKKIDLFLVDMKESDLVTLSSLKNLTHIHIGKTGLGVDALGPLKNFKSLVYLDLVGTPLSNKDLARVIAMHPYEELKLQDCGFNQTVADVLKNYTSLKKLQIRTGVWTDEEFQDLRIALPDIKIW